MLQNYMSQHSCRCHHNNIITIKKIMNQYRQNANFWPLTIFFYLNFWTILDYFNLVVENCVHLSHRPTTTSISGLSQNLQIQFYTKMYCVIFLSNSDEPWFSKVKRKTFTFLCSTYCCCRFHSSKCNWSREIETKYWPCCQ